RPWNGWTATWVSRHSTWVPARATRCWICCMPSRKPAATNFPTSSPTAAPATSPAATPTPPSPPKNSAGAPNSASKPCAPTPGAGSPTTPKATAKPSLHRAHPLRTRGGCSYGFGGGLGFVVGAPPTVRTGRAQTTSHSSPPSHPGRGLLRVGVGIGVVAGAPPAVRTGRAQSTCPSRPPSRPGRVLLRVGVGMGFVVGAPPSVRRGRARIRTRGGCSYGSELGLVRLEEHRLGAHGSGTYSHPGRVLLRFGVGIGFVVGAPPSVRTGRARCEPGGVGFWFWGLKFRARAPTSCPVALFSECLACSVYRLSCCWEQLCLPRL